MGIASFKRLVLAGAGIACLGAGYSAFVWITSASAAPTPGVDPLAVVQQIAPVGPPPVLATSPAKPAQSPDQTAASAADHAVAAPGNAIGVTMPTVDPAASAATDKALASGQTPAVTVGVQPAQVPAAPPPIMPVPSAPSTTGVAAAVIQAAVVKTAMLMPPRAWPVDRVVLKKDLVALTPEPRVGVVRVPDGKAIRPGERSPAMPAIRTALRSFGYLAPDAAPAKHAARQPAATDPAFAYDDATLDAVRRFQFDSGLMDDGVIGGATRRALRSQDSNPTLRLEQTLAQHVNLPTKGRAVVVNVAAGLVYAMEDGKVVMISRAVVGNPTHQTPLFSARITSVTLNPYWTTPDSITKAEFGGSTHIEHPGPDNPLGKVRLDMPNRYEVFLHSTNTPRLFARDVRAFSHGCVRVEQVQALAKWLLGDQAWAEAGADATLQTWKYKQVKLAASVPVYIGYWTASVGSTGATIYHADPYRLTDPQPAASPQSLPSNPAYPVPPGYIGPPPAAMASAKTNAMPAHTMPVQSSAVSPIHPTSYTVPARRPATVIQN